MSSHALASTGVSNYRMGDKQNETEPSASEVVGEPWEGSGDLVLVTHSSLWTCPVAPASTSPGWAPAGLSLGAGLGHLPSSGHSPHILSSEHCCPRKGEGGHPQGNSIRRTETPTATSSLRGSPRDPLYSPRHLVDKTVNMFALRNVCVCDVIFFVCLKGHMYTMLYCFWLAPLTCTLTASQPSEVCECTTPMVCLCFSFL